MKLRFLLFVCVVLTSYLIIIGCDDDDKNPLSATNPADMPYSIIIDPADFRDTSITGNTCVPIVVNTTFIYEGEDEDGAVIRVEEKVTDQTKVIMGVTCVVFRAKEFEDGNLIEDTFDWYAQDIEGNV